MKTKNKNILVFLIVIVLVGLSAWLVYNKQLQGNGPDIDHIYKASDFPDATDMTQDEIQTDVDILNDNYQILRDNKENVDFDTYNNWINIGNAKYYLKDFVGAVEAWKYATTINDVNPLAYANLANYYKMFTHDYEEAEYYYQMAIARDNTGYFYDYVAYAELYLDYLPKDLKKAEGIMLSGAEKAQGIRKLDFYRHLYYMWLLEGNQEKVDFYKQKVLDIDPNFQF